MKSGIYLTTFTIIIGIFSLNTAPASIITDGLVSYWTFDKGSIVNKNVKDVWGVIDVQNVEKGGLERKR